MLKPFRSRRAVVEIKVAVRWLVRPSISYAATGCSVVVGPEIDDRDEWNEYPASSSQPTLCRRQGRLGKANYADTASTIMRWRIDCLPPPKRRTALLPAPADPLLASRLPTKSSPFSFFPSRLVAFQPGDDRAAVHLRSAADVFVGLHSTCSQAVVRVRWIMYPRLRISLLFTPEMSYCTARDV